MLKPRDYEMNAYFNVRVVIEWYLIVIAIIVDTVDWVGTYLPKLYQ